MSALFSLLSCYVGISFSKQMFLLLEFNNVVFVVFAQCQIAFGGLEDRVGGSSSSIKVSNIMRLSVHSRNSNSDLIESPVETAKWLFSASYLCLDTTSMELKS